MPRKMIYPVREPIGRARLKKTSSATNSGAFSNGVYLDYAATTPLDKEVEKKMIPFGRVSYGNPRALHALGQEAKKAVEEARREVARFLGAPKEAVIFNSGGTEGNNQAIIGITRAWKKNQKTLPEIIITALEHASIIAPAEAMAGEGSKLTILPVDSEGSISISDLKKALTPNTAVVAVILVQNEIGTVFPIQEVRKEIDRYKKILGRKKDEGPYLHIDATQAPRVLSLKPLYRLADSFIFDGSKIYGPKGTGVWVHRPTLPVLPFLYGGGQERGLRSGTENVSGIVGFAVALKLAIHEATHGYKKLARLKNKFLSDLKKTKVDFVINGNLVKSVPSILNISIPGILAETLLLALSRQGIFISTTSACASPNNAASRTILALGKSEEMARSSVRISFGRETKISDVVYSARCFGQTVYKLRAQP